jgi:hypothetical protein
MQGLATLDLARILAEEHLRSLHAAGALRRTAQAHTVRHWLGSHLIQLGEALTPKPTELQLKVSTGPPYPWE